MKTKLKNLFIAALLVAPVMFIACSGDKTAGAKDYNDTIYSRSYILQLSISDPDKALAIVDTLEQVGKYPSYFINYLRSGIYNNSAQLRSAIHYAKLAIADTRFKKEDLRNYLGLLLAIAQIEQMNDNYAKSINIVKEALEIANENGVEYIQALCYYLMGRNQIVISELGEGLMSYLKSNDIAVKLLNAEPSAPNFELVYGTTIGIIEALHSAGKDLEAEKYLPKLLELIEKADKIQGINEFYIDSRKCYIYMWFYNIYNDLGKTEEAEKYRKMSEATQSANLPYVRERYTSYYISKKDYKKALENIGISRQFYVEDRDTFGVDYLNDVLYHEFNVYNKMGNYAMAAKVAEKINVCRDSVDKKTKEEDAGELAKIYETQEKEKQIAEQKTELTKQRNMLIGVALLLVLGVTFIVIVMRFNRKLNRRNKTIVATINQMMQKEDQLTRLQLGDDINAENIDPEEIRLKQSLEMLKDDKSIDDIVTQCGYRDANDFNNRFYEHFGIHSEEYRKWSKNISSQEKTGIEEANQMKQSFIRNMSHEIRTPLNQIYGFVQLLTTPGIQLSDEQKQKFTGIIGEQTSHMTQMLNTFLEMSQYESSSEPLPVDTVDIGELLTMSCSSFQNIKDGVELSAKNNSGLVTLKCNQKGLLRILHCIIDNAVKFTDKGLVSVECASYAEGNIVFSVTDTGKGIPEGDEERIFEQFYKVDEFIPGTGLGLSLARAIADRMGASIAVDRSYEAQGSRFNIVLKS